MRVALYSTVAKKRIHMYMCIIKLYVAKHVHCKDYSPSTYIVKTTHLSSNASGFQYPSVSQLH